MSISPSDPILVIGAGSIGERHLGNLAALGYSRLLVLRSRRLPLRNVREEGLTVLTSWEEVKQHRPRAAFICTPTSGHLSQAVHCAEAGMHILVEKPVSHSTQGKEELTRAVALNGVWFQVGYMMRYHPFVHQIREWMQKETWGKLISFSSHWGEYLPNWHPWEDYRESYAARKELGGGSALTLSHDLDLALFLAGSPLVTHSSLLNFRSDLEVNTDAGADFLLGFENGLTGHVHLNFFQKTARREYRFEFTEASVVYRYFDNELEVRTGNETRLLSYPGFDRNQLFLDQTKDFFQQIGSFSIGQSLQNIEDAFRIVSLCQGEAP